MHTHSRYPMDRDTANATRLRVNRIALIQQLDVQELLPKLVRARILTADHDVNYIYQGTSRIDRARRLLDRLQTSTDGERVDRPANWFLQFRGILQENPSIYGNLIAALDNTIIRAPDFAQRTGDAFTDKSNVERAEAFRTNVNKDLLRVSEVRADNESKSMAHAERNHEQITKIEFDPYARNRIFIEGQFQKVIDNLTYHSQVDDRQDTILCVNNIRCYCRSIDSYGFLLIVVLRFLNDCSNNCLNHRMSTILNNSNVRSKCSTICVA
jgi:hypothetical protein